MDKTSLLILAGGMGSRYRGSKQIDTVGSGNERLMEFAIFDALKIGIRKFVLIINSKFPEDYKIKLQKILENNGAELNFVVQKIDTLIPERFHSKLQNRKKPLGTGHAVYCAKNVINGPFVTINADDYYGRQSFENAAELIKNHQISNQFFGMTAFELQNTLSENGSVSRGICRLNGDLLESVEEFTSIQKINDQISGQNEKGESKKLNQNDLVSMNFWILDDSFFRLAEDELTEFLENTDDFSKSEFYLPSVIDKAIHQNRVRVRVLKTSEKWFGLTYREDKENVVKEIESMQSTGIYPKKLWQK
ncbi:MAG: dTDP-glucose pyrophosphorylase [Flavobacteriia bacterium]|nr:dTDP-glucose pyrophosphorylase [Flavobacteriia bacterium]